MPCVCAPTRTSSRCTTTFNGAALPLTRRSRNQTGSREFDAETRRKRREESSKSKPESAEEAEVVKAGATRATGHLETLRSCLLHFGHELVGQGAVDQAVVEAQ